MNASPPHTLLHRTLEALEWPRFLALAAEEAYSEPAQAQTLELLSPLNWAKNAGEAQARQDEAAEIGPLLDREPLWAPLHGLASPDLLVEKLSRGGILEVPELNLLRSWLRAMDAWTHFPREEIRSPSFKRALQVLPDPTVPLNLLERLLTQNGELSERASSRLFQIHSDLRSLKKEIQQAMDAIVRDLDAQGVLMDQFADVRDGRYVVPVRSSHQSEVEGILYEASVSKQTVYIEPKEISGLNNRLRKKQNELLEEISIILKNVSLELAGDHELLRTGVAILTRWDSIQARTRVGRRTGSKPIVITSGPGRHLRLTQTAHPLLWQSLPEEKIIRNTIYFSDPHQTLLLTGPNTGGKTVFLKTVGLAALFAKTGFPFPGLDRAEVPFFDSIFADLGDPQSIEAHLSSFSGHMMRFKDILENSTGQSLVLLDELNTATDPEEGAAIGQAFLQILMNRGVWLVSTTHDPKLKAAALKDSRILNASMAFDETRREPTFQILVGLVGRSRALETAERLGLGTELLQLARSFLSQEHQYLEKGLQDLEHKLKTAESDRREAERERLEAERLRREWTERTQATFNETLQKVRNKLKRTLEQAQDEIRLIARRLDEARSRKDLDQSRSEINELMQTAQERIESSLKEEAPELDALLSANSQSPHSSHSRVTPSPAPASPTFQIGDWVRIPKWKTTGTVLDLRGDQVKVAMGQIQVQMSLREIFPLSRAVRRQVSEQNQRAETLRKRSSEPVATSSELDLRGKRLDDAMRELEAFLDLCFRAGTFSEVTIIHGYGTGALREGAHALLKKIPYVKRYHSGSESSGSTGVTRVEFDF